VTTVAIHGNTFPVKDQIKALGGRWNPDLKSWMVPTDQAETARALVSGAPKQPYSGARRSSSTPGRCTHCGDTCNARYRTCLECSHGGQSFHTASGQFILGSDD
jgi:hypothetical protein